MPTTLRGAILTLLALSLPSCTYWSGDPTVRISSTPAGAFIFLDGEDTGETTPAMLDLGTFLNLDGFLGSDRVVTIRKKGYEPERRILHHHATRRIKVQPVGTQREHLWIRLAARYIVSADDGRHPLRRPHRVEHQIDVLARTR